VSAPIQEAIMTTLHIEHPIADFDHWKAAFDRFAPARAQSGVRAHRVHRPLDDPRYVLIDLDFGTTGEAQRFLRFLQENVWSSRDSSPALAGDPQTRLLDLAESQPAAST
jgi:hypothetical protein